MKTSVLCLSFLLSLTSLTLTSEEEELRQINLGQIGPSALGLLTAAIAGAGTAGLAGLALSGGKGGKGGLFGHDGLFGKHWIFGGKHGKGKKRSLIADEERQDISGLLSLLGGNAESTSANEVAGGKGKDGKGKDGKGKGKDGKGKGKDGKGGKGKEGKGKEGKGGKGNESAAESSILDTLSNNLLGQIIQSVLGLLTGAVSSLNPLKSAMEPKTTTPPLPNPLTDPLGFIMHPLISDIINAIVAGDIPALMKAQGELAGTLITQFITNAIAG